MLKQIASLACAFSLTAGAAYADTISLSAMGFVRYDPAGTTQDPTPDNGTLSPVIGATLFAPVDFPVNGQNVCSLSLTYGDTNMAESISATLFRKRISNGGTVNAAPQAMAKVTSGLTVTGMRTVSTTTVSNRTINEAGFFYYVQVDAPNFNTPLVGVRIDHQATCP